MFCKLKLTLGSVVPLTMFQIYLGKSFDILHVRFDVIFVLQRVGGNSWHGESPFEIVGGRQLSVDRSGLSRDPGRTSQNIFGDFRNSF